MFPLSQISCPRDLLQRSPTARGDQTDWSGRELLQKSRAVGDSLQEGIRFYGTFNSV